ncbi:MAG: hypothetical protein R3F35_01600 [Myxococcota bacterium]
MAEKDPEKARLKAQLDAALEYAEALRVMAAESGQRAIELEWQRVARLPKRERDAMRRLKALRFYAFLTAEREKPIVVQHYDGGTDDGKPWTGVLSLPMSPDDALALVAERFGSNSPEAARRMLHRERRGLQADHALRSVRLPSGWSD